MEENNMTTTTNKDKPGKTPLSPDKKSVRNTVSLEERKRRRDAMLDMAKELGFKKVPLKGAIIWFPDGTLF